MVKNVWLLGGLPNLAVKTFEAQTKKGFEKLDVCISGAVYSDGYSICNLLSPMCKKIRRTRQNHTD